MPPHETKTINIGAQIRNKHNKQNPQTSSISYTYHTYNPNRLSSYDNDIYEYNNNNNNNTVNQNKNDFDTSFLKTTNSSFQSEKTGAPQLVRLQVLGET